MLLPLFLGDVGFPGVFRDPGRQWSALRSMEGGIILPSAGGTAPINPDFQTKLPLFAVAILPKGTHAAALPATTPLAWNRGLQPDGDWSLNIGPYKDVGGFVLFADGHVNFFKNGIDGRLTTWGTAKGPTSNILEALPPGTRISDCRPYPNSP